MGHHSHPAKAPAGGIGRRLFQADGHPVGALLGAGLACLYYRIMSFRQFGGVTGDLAGFFLQTCELAMVLAVVIVQKVVAIL